MNEMARTLNRFCPVSACVSACVSTVCAIVLAAGVLAGCAGSSAVSDTHYDFGPAPAAMATSAAMPTIKVLAVGAPETMASDKIIYRLSYADAQQTASYANSHWTMTPSELLTQRLRNALSLRGTVLTGGDAVSAPVLRVDLSEFEQIFDSQTQSHGSVIVRATLTHRGKVLAQQTFMASAPAKSPDAAGGAQALAAASDDVVTQISNWLGSQALAAAQ
jgi:cholesterol transport system auxiliary component